MGSKSMPEPVRRYEGKWALFILGGNWDYLIEGVGIIGTDMSNCMYEPLNMYAR